MPGSARTRSMLVNILVVLSLASISGVLAQQPTGDSRPTYEFGAAPLEEAAGPRVHLIRETPADQLLGEGVDTVTGAMKGKALVVSSSVPETMGQKVEYSLVEVESLSELRREMGISASASYSGVGGGGSAKIDLVRKAAFNSYSIFLVVRTKVTNAAIPLKEFNLRREAQSLFRRSVPEFFRTYGDEFIDSVVTGGEFFGLVEFVSQSSVEQESIRAEVRGSVGSFSAAANFSQAIEKISKEKTTKINIVRVGGTGPVPTNIKEAALNFPKEVDPAQGGKPVVIGFTTRSFNVVSNRPAGKFVPDLTPQRRALGELVEGREFGQRVKSDIAFILDFPSQFEAVDPTGLQRKATAVDSKIQSIDRRLQQIVDAPLNAPPATATDFSDVLPLNTRKSGVVLPLKITVHQQNLGDLTFSDSVWAGAKGSRLRVEGFAIEFQQPLPGVTIEYMAHLENTGDVPYKASPQFIGTRGESRRLEGFAIRLAGARAKYYRVTYRCFLSGVGEVGPSEENGFCGTRGQSRPLEAMYVTVISR